jgi:prepilin-type N-terminal cleavage/methylation domain-containing protein
LPSFPCLRSSCLTDRVALRDLRECGLNSTIRSVPRAGVAVAHRFSGGNAVRRICAMIHPPLQDSGRRGAKCRRCLPESGFSLIEAMVAMAILSLALVSLADLLAMATRANMTARNTTRAVILAEQKMEQLNGLAWSFDDAGARVSDVSSNVAAFPPTGSCASVTTGAAVGLTPSPSGALDANMDGYVDYVDAQGCGLGGGAVPPPGTTHVRRWSIDASPGIGDTLVLQVLVTDRGIRSAASRNASGRRMPDDAILVGVKTRRAP